MLSLYREQPEGGVVVCFDEMGPIQLIPHQGSGWAPEKHPSACGRPTTERAGFATSTGLMTFTPIASTAGFAPARASMR